jgi:type II secretory pathway pseudopilin PulG
MIAFKKNKKNLLLAFTFTELMVVILIISLVTTVAIASVSVIKRSARDKKVLSNISELRLALESYKMVEGDYPDNENFNSGEQLVGPSGVVFYDKIPDNIFYNYDQDYRKYSISFQLEGDLDNLSSGYNCVVNESTINQPCCPFGVSAYLKADGNVNDYLGNYNGVFTGPAYVEGKLGQAFSFNGSNNYISLNSPIEFSVGTSLSLWIDFNNISTTRYFIGDSSRTVGIRYSGTEFLAFQGGAGYTGISWSKLNGFVHLVIIKVDSYNFDFYINGVKIGTSYSGANSSNILIDFIGRRLDGYYFLGPIDEVMFFNRELSLDEINFLYEMGNTCYYPN